MLVVTFWLARRDNREHEIFQTSRVDHLLKHGFSIPALRCPSDPLLWDKLCAVAEFETQKRKAPCIYLGLALGNGKYEPDPFNWPFKSYSCINGKDCATVYFEWAGVTIHGAAHVVKVAATDVLLRQKELPFHPLAHSAPSCLKFSIAFMESVAKNVHEEVEFRGTGFEGESSTLTLQLPFGGTDCQDEPLYWTLPGGRCEVCSVRRMSETTQDLLAHQDSEDAYKSVAKAMEYDCLGTAAEEELEPFRLAPGTLVERLWEKIEWLRPSDETRTCWWIANAGEPDKTTPVKLVAKSLTCIRLELQSTRCATSTKLRQTWERRLEENALAVDALSNNAQLWRHVGGPDPELLLRPSEVNLKAARRAVHQLQYMCISHGPDAHDGLDVPGGRAKTLQSLTVASHQEYSEYLTSALRRGGETMKSAQIFLFNGSVFAEEIIRAVGMLKEVSWEAIRRE